MASLLNFYEANITLITKADKDITRRENYRSILDRKRHNSISEAKTREKHKKEA